MKDVSTLNKQFKVSLDLPGSKSITLRDAVLASLAHGKSCAAVPRRVRRFRSTIRSSHPAWSYDLSTHS